MNWTSCSVQVEVPSAARGEAPRQNGGASRRPDMDSTWSGASLVSEGVSNCELALVPATVISVYDKRCHTLFRLGTATGTMTGLSLQL